MKSLNFNIITEFHKSQHEETFLTAINKLDNKAERSTASRFCKTTDRSIVTFGTNNLISNKNVASVQKRRRLYLNIKTIIKIWETVSTWQSQFQRKKIKLSYFSSSHEENTSPQKKKLLPEHHSSNKLYNNWTFANNLYNNERHDPFFFHEISIQASRHSYERNLNFRISRSTLNLACLDIERQRQWCKMIHLKGLPFNIATYGQSDQAIIVS